LVIGPYSEPFYEVGAPFHVNLLVDGGLGHDVIDVRGEYAPPQSLSLGPFGPGVVARYTGVVQVNVRGGSSDDYLNVQWEDLLYVVVTAIADGGSGVDAAITSANVTVMNCEF
jgi:hypothetical protein